MSLWFRVSNPAVTVLRLHTVGTVIYRRGSVGPIGGQAGPMSALFSARRLSSETAVFFVSALNAKHGTPSRRNKGEKRHGMISLAAEKRETLVMA